MQIQSKFKLFLLTQLFFLPTSADFNRNEAILLKGVGNRFNIDLLALIPAVQKQNLEQQWNDLVYSSLYLVDLIFKGQSQSQQAKQLNIIAHDAQNIVNTLKQFLSFVDLTSQVTDAIYYNAQFPAQYYLTLIGYPVNGQTSSQILTNWKNSNADLVNATFNPIYVENSLVLDTTTLLNLFDQLTDLITPLLEQAAANPSESPPNLSAVEQTAIQIADVLFNAAYPSNSL